MTTALVRRAATVLILVSAPAGFLNAQDDAPVLSFMARKILERNVEGPDVQRTYFLYGNKRIAFGLPSGVTLNEGAASASLQFAGGGVDGTIQVSRSPFTPTSGFAATKEVYRKDAETGLPGTATDIHFHEMDENPYPYHGWSSMGFTWEYVLDGRSRTDTTTYINLEFGIQVKITTSAATTDASKVFKAAQEFMRSWWVMGSLEPVPLPRKQ